MSKEKIYINGNEYLADTEKSLLDNILESGVYVPHLCHNKELESYGGCGLCLVEIEGFRRPVRACGTSTVGGMKVTTSTPEIEKSRKATLSLIMSDHGGDCKAPCFMACPTHQDIQGYVGLIANGKEREALELIKKDNPLPASIGRVCPHPCEEKCRRKYLEGAVSVCALKRYAADCYEDYIPQCEASNGKTVAVVGGGPAGLSCAYFLAIKGYKVKVFEAQNKAGGMLRYGIPAYRLPKDILDKEIENIEKMGVEFVYSKKLGADFTVSSLKKEYDAVFIGTGAWRSYGLGCEGDGADGVVGGIDMLYRVAKGEDAGIGEKVCVVGGGNTAIDAVRTAVRLGARKVTLVYRRTEKEMPAEPDEIRDAKNEGVEFKFLASPLEAVTENGRVKGLKIQNMQLGEPDASGRRRPVAIEGSTEILECDTVISAVGQCVVAEDLDCVELTAKSTVAVDEKTYMTSVSGVFAAGDVINKGPDIAVRAIAGGKYAARSIDCFLNGVEVPSEIPRYSVNEHFDESVLEGTPVSERCETVLTDPDVRKKSFDEVARTFTVEEARAEASRCLECGCSAVYSCELLPLARQYGAFSDILKGKSRQFKKDKSHPFIVRDNNKCILCAQCVMACREISGTENLGLFGRGFGTVPTTAFGLPLNESKCVSCGACADVCPTGALTVSSISVKNPPLPFSEEDYVCTYCSQSCEFTKRTVNGRTVRMIPKKLSECCSVGMYFDSVRDNIPNGICDETSEAVRNCLSGSLQKYNGDRKSLDEIIEKILK